LLDIPIQTLSATPVNGVSLGGVSVLRLDQLGGPVSGNKSFKLRPYLKRAESQDVRTLVSFGGPWSNHLHALAAVGKEQGFHTIGIVRGEAHEADTAMLEDARNWGMQVIRLSRSEYRRRNEAGFLAAMEQRFAPCVVIPEGGSSLEAMLACTEVAEYLSAAFTGPTKVITAVGTGTTLAGIAAGLGCSWSVLGISALKGADDLEMRVASLLDESGLTHPAQWSIDHRFHCGGFARVSPQLKDFVLAFEAVHKIPLDPVYTAKAMFALSQLRSAGEVDEREPVIVVHTGGLQGRRGQAWMSSPAPAI
jgi:1-aminocyclopropane-1-carboxylate deaminase/D-cysteine desulfhydrase-like pyridoxal-dependent ACC family enzyme